ncbi:MAG: hypothetical protein M3Z17_00950 [Gemmatimonadota bacterium]|nr:hypothetical protein [Gemmatimonadota bacterium]
MTDAGADALRLLLRRAGHELRNAQNAAAVNLEVVRSRVAAGKTNAESLQSFADNAAAGLEASATLAEALVALCSAVTSSLAAARVRILEQSSNGVVIELRMTEADGVSLVGRVSALAERAGFGVEPRQSGVILRIPPDNETNRA